MMKNVHRWMGSYIKQSVARTLSKNTVKGPKHVMFCFVDHYEPDWGKADDALQLNRVKRWLEEYPKLAGKYKDADGCYPKHSFFYPAEVYNKEHLELLKKICDQGFGEVEIHLHHDNDTEESLKQKLEQAKVDFLSHGLLNKRKLSGLIRYGFIHGNWALNNSRCDGKWCGVNDESTILSDSGCYADFTFPSAPSETQPKKINSIYYSRSNKLKPKSHNKGTDVQVGSYADDELLIIQGPLTLNWKNRKFGILPRIENSDITGVNHPTEDRVDLWVDQNISVKGKEDWVFVKVHTHGAPEKNADALLGEPLERMFQYLDKKYNDGNNYVLHYVSAREMYNIIKAAEAGEAENPHLYRDYFIERNQA